MTTIQQFFRYSARWNIFESVVYQTVLFIHQWALYTTIPIILYGQVGSLFSAIYLAANALNFGLNDSIAPFFFYAKQSKQAAYQFIIHPLLIQTLLLITLGVFFLGVSLMNPHMTGTIEISSLSILLAVCTFITESLKKTIRTILYCAFFNTITTFVELCTITCYLATVWSSIMMGYTDINTFIFPMVITSFISLFILLFMLKLWYSNLESTNVVRSYPSYRRLLKQRLSSYGVQLSTIAFSSNFLVLFFSYKFGLIYAALLKLISYMTYYIHTVLHKALGISLQSCLATLKEKSDEEKKHFFGKVCNYLYQSLYAIIIFCLINGQSILDLKNIVISHETIIVGYLFFTALIIENILVVYEPLYHNEEKTYYLSIANIINCLLFYMIVLLGITASPISFLLTFIGLRSVTIVGIVTNACYLWNTPIYILPNAQISLGCIIISCLFWIGINYL